MEQKAEGSNQTATSTTRRAAPLQDYLENRNHFGKPAWKAGIQQAGLSKYGLTPTDRNRLAFSIYSRLTDEERASQRYQNDIFPQLKLLITGSYPEKNPYFKRIFEPIFEDATQFGKPLWMNGYRSVDFTSREMEKFVDYTCKNFRPNEGKEKSKAFHDDLSPTLQLLVAEHQGDDELAKIHAMTKILDTEGQHVDPAYFGETLRVSGLSQGNENLMLQYLEHTRNGKPTNNRPWLWRSRESGTFKIPQRVGSGHSATDVNPRKRTQEDMGEETDLDRLPKRIRMSSSDISDLADHLERSGYTDLHSDILGRISDSLSAVSGEAGKAAIYNGVKEQNLGNHEDAIQHFERALRLPNFPEQHPKVAADLYSAQGFSYSRIHDLKKAEESFKKSFNTLDAIVEETTQTREMKAEALYNWGRNTENPEQAEKRLRKVLSLSRSIFGEVSPALEGLASYHLGMSLLERGKGQEAETFLNDDILLKKLQPNPNPSSQNASQEREVRFALANVFHMRGDTEAAIDILQDGLNLSGQGNIHAQIQGEKHIQLGEWLKEAGRYQEAFDAFKKVPHDEDIHEEAMATLEDWQEHEISPSQLQAKTHVAHGIAAHQMLDTRTSTEQLERGLRDPSLKDNVSVQLYGNLLLATSLGELGKQATREEYDSVGESYYRASLEACEKIDEIANTENISVPDHILKKNQSNAAEAHYGLAIALQNQEKHGEAEEIFEYLSQDQHMESHHPSLKWAIPFHHSESLHALGNHQRAVELRNEALNTMEMERIDKKQLRAGRQELGEWHLEEGEINESFDAFKKVTQDHPLLQEAIKNLQKSLASDNDRESATAKKKAAAGFSELAAQTSESPELLLQTALFAPELLEDKGFQAHAHLALSKYGDSDQKTHFANAHMLLRAHPQIQQDNPRLKEAFQELSSIQRRTPTPPQSPRR